MASPTLPEIRAAIVAVLGAVSGIGQVHGYQRFARSETTFRAAYASGGRINGWDVHRASRAEQSPGLGRWHVRNEWTIRGFYSVDDDAPSQAAFDSICEAAVEAFRADEDLGGLIVSHTDTERAGLQIEAVDFVMFAGVLCHRAVGSLMTLHDE